MKTFLLSSYATLVTGLASVRICVGLLLLYHGVEVFNTAVMAGYLQWETFRDPGAKYFVYMGKVAELVAGLLLTCGLFTRIGGILTLGTFLYITFFVGRGRFWYEDQHPFLFALFGMLFLLTGPGKWSLDTLWMGKTKVFGEPR